jgi:hypothetical protein
MVPRKIVKTSWILGQILKLVWTTMKTMVKEVTKEGMSLMPRLHLSMKVSGLQRQE